MQVLRVDPESPEPELIGQAAAVLRDGGLVAFPTETVYGLGAHALDAEAVRRIFRAKDRPAFNPLIAHVSGIEGARRLAAEWPPEAQRLAEAFWPGPLTLVLPKQPHVPDVLTAGLAAVGVRVPAHPVALALITAAGVPIAAPSANRFTELSPTTATHVLKGLGDRVDILLDGGPTMVGIESTVVDLTGPAPLVLRPGVLSAHELSEIVGQRVERAGDPSGSAPRRSPGMVERHYAPKAELRVLDPAALARSASAAGPGAASETGALLLHPLAVGADHVIRMPTDPAGYARQLYAALHSLDDAGCRLILVEQVPEGEAWAGVQDRLRRAARERPNGSPEPA